MQLIFISAYISNYDIVWSPILVSNCQFLSTVKLGNIYTIHGNTEICKWLATFVQEMSVLVLHYTSRAVEATMNVFS